MFTAENTTGFSDAEISLMNAALDLLVSAGIDEKNASDIINNNYTGNGDTVESLSGRKMTKTNHAAIKDFHKKAMNTIDAVKSDTENWSLDEVKQALNEDQEDTMRFHFDADYYKEAQNAGLIGDVYAEMCDLRSNYESEAQSLIDDFKSKNEE